MKKFWLISAMTATLALAACSSEDTTNEAAEEENETAEEVMTEDPAEETEEPSLYVIGDEAEVNGAVMTVTQAQVVEEIDESQRVYEITLNVTNDSDEDISLTNENFTLLDWADEEKELHGEEVDLTVSSGESAEASFQYAASASTAFKFMGTIEDQEVEWRLPGITALD
ncbi:hypothetical protein [Jeotgalibacillus campisalis]|uniref:DUF4352 domain-containing protein n=1 Tax=Jeotgalibacillus campisalis TaxID=220754 RepID=A0A0C2VDU8_9BACL|nr:hypothetical protein [Jeotgalibacillus campisalis]KIL47092.1 hypothetical protein KR50_24140 [Jeotgalibacillus campisalis]